MLIVIYLLSLVVAKDALTQSSPTDYLADVKMELQKKWPQNRTVNLVFHGHSVPAGYFATPNVHTVEAYPHLSLQKVKEVYPWAVVNAITTAIGGEQAESGARRFSSEVLTHRPDVVFIDYALNDRGIGLERAKVAWEQMIRAALDQSVKVILLTPTPDLREDILAEHTPLAQHARQIRELAVHYGLGLVDSYQIFREIAGKEDLRAYMAQGNHINGLGHELVATEIMNWLQDSPLPGYALEWSDEFNGTMLDLSRWGYRKDNKHRSVQLAENVSVQGGALVLDLRVHEQPIAGKRASGAGIVSKRRFRYGYYEVRASLGDGRDEDGDGKTDEGWHHAFWAMAATFDEAGAVNTTYPGIRRTEIDGFENSSEHRHDEDQSGLDRFTQHVIVWDENGKEWGRLPQPPADLTVPKNFDPYAWHVYGFEWTEREIRFYVDGALTQIADYPADRFTHDEINVWLTAIAANWNREDQEPSRARYDYFRFYKKNNP